MSLNKKLKNRDKTDNFLEYVPKKNIEWETDGNEKVTLLKEKTSNKIYKKVISFFNKDQFIRIHLDETGSKVWKKIDGVKKISDICKELRSDQYSEFPNAEERVSYFIGMMKKSKFVDFV